MILLLTIKIAIGLMLAVSMFILRPVKYRFIMKHGKRIDAIGHSIVGFYCYWWTQHILTLFLIFVAIEAIQKIFCKREFGYDDIFFSMAAVTIIYFIHNFLL